MKCKKCGKTPQEIAEYQEIMAECDESGKPFYTDWEEMMSEEEGTFNPNTKQFYCTECYIKIGMPLGTA